MSWLVHLVHTPFLVPASPIFNYVTASDPQSPSHDSLAESVTQKVNPTPRNNNHNLVPNVPDDPDSDPSLSDSSLLGSSYSSDDKYHQIRLRAKKNKNKRQSKTRFSEPIKKCPKLTAKLLTNAYKPKVVNFKLGEDPL